MKRFHWPLLKLLEVTAQRELAARAELLALAGRITAFRQEIIARRVKLRGLLAELGAMAPTERIGMQALFMTCAEVDRRAIRAIEGQIEALESERAEKTRHYRQIKVRRETLERLREEATARYRKELLREEQKLLDESATIAFSRVARAART